MTHKVRVTIEIDGVSHTLKSEFSDALVRNSNVDVIKEGTLALAEVIVDQIRIGGYDDHEKTME